MAAERKLKLTNGGEIELFEPAAGGTSFIEVKAPALAASWTLTLPTTDGNAGEILTTDGAGVTSWVATLTAFDVDALSTDGLTVLNQGKVNFREAVGGGINTVSLQAPAALGGDVTFTLPGTDGGADDVLVTDGAGALSFKETLASLTITALTSAGIVITNEGLLTLREAVAHGTNEVTFKAPHDLAADTDYTWPTAIVAGNFLQTDAAGNLSWAASAATLQTAYDAGEDIVMIADTIDISQANDVGMLTLTKTGANAGVVLDIHNDGTGRAIQVHQDGAGIALYVQQDANAVGIFLQQNVANYGMQIDQSANAHCLYLNKTGAGAGSPLYIHDDGTGYSLYIHKDGNAEAIVVDQDGAADGIYCRSFAGHTCLTLVKDNVNVDPCIYITNNSPNYDIYSSVGGWYVEAGGGATFMGLRLPHSHETISGGAITIDANQCFIIVDTEGAAATDDLDNINGGTDGQIIILRCADDGRQVRLRDNSTGGGNIYNTSSGIFDMDNSEDTAMYIYDATAGKWLCISLSNNGA